MAGAVVAEVAVDLDGDVAAAARQARGLDVEAAVGERDVQRHRRHALSFGEQPKAVGDRLDVVAEAHDRLQVALGEDQEAAHESFAFGSVGWPLARQVAMPPASAVASMPCLRSATAAFWLTWKP